MLGRFRDQSSLLIANLPSAVYSILDSIRLSLYTSGEVSIFGMANAFRIFVLYLNEFSCGAVAA